MRKFLNVMIWLTSVGIVCLWTWGSFWQGGGNMQELPTADLKLRIPSGETVQSTLDRVTKILESRGYINQNYYDNGQWDSSQSYKKDKFEVSYSPHDGVQTKLGVIYVYFYEEGANLFSEAGIEEYDALSQSFSNHGLERLGEDAVDKTNNRWVGTPQMFNERQHSPIVEASRKKVFQFQLGILACYSVIVLWPGFSIALKYFDHLLFPYLQKRILFSISTSFFLAPGLFLLPPFDPFLLIPLPLALLFALFTMAAELFVWAGVSFVGMLIIAFLISLLLKKSHATIA